MSRDAETFRNFANVLESIDEHGSVDAVDIDYTSESTGMLEMVNQMAGVDDQYPLFKLVFDPGVDDVDDAFDALADVVEMLENEHDVDVKRANAGEYETERGWPFSSESSRTVFGIIVDARVAGDLGDDDELEQPDDDDEPTSTSIEFDDPTERDAR